jgi:hypothetical protein
MSLGVPGEQARDFRLRDESGIWRTPASARGDVLVRLAELREPRDELLVRSGQFLGLRVVRVLHRGHSSYSATR